jgi:A/G-specific adenine glycosylase
VPAEIARRLLSWYAVSARSLPWRGVIDPYAVWVSEIMLQQTRVETVIPYYERWMAAFPEVATLAAASEQDVLRLWEGLGYYSRARNLHKAAQIVVTKNGGNIPSEIEALEKLPGIGHYTAGAIASMAFGKDEPALDGNIRRVLARLFDVEIPARSPQGEKALLQLAWQELPPGQAGDFNQALMDLGSGICTPRNPHCGECPLESVCRAYLSGTQEQRPVLESRPAVPHITVTAAIIAQQGKVLIARRPSKGLLGGLWEFPGGTQEVGEELSQCLIREIKEELGCQVLVLEPAGVYQHAYTHFKVTLHAFHCSLAEGLPMPLVASELRWVGPEELANFPMGKIDRRISHRLRKETDAD